MNNQFRVAITQHLTKLYNEAVDNFYDVDNELQQYPRSNDVKVKWAHRLTEKFAYARILHHIEEGKYDDKEYYEKYIKK
jgi:hypothetical protein